MPPSPPETRASLILRLQNAADVTAWEEFTQVYGPVVFRVARQQGLQAADADDLVQEVFSSVARSVTQWLERNDRGSFRAWLFRIAKNVAVNFLTRRRHRPWAAGGESAFDDLQQLAAPTEELRSDFDLEYRREVFLWASARVRDAVTDATWQSFYRTNVHEESIDDVARQLGVSPGSVYIARCRVMKRLKVAVMQFEESTYDDM